MKGKILIFVLSVFLFASCKDDKTSTPESKEAVKKIKVTLSATVKTDDDFQLFFKEEDNASKPFEEVNSVWTAVKANENSQNIEFVLPEDVFPNYLRLDIGKNDKQQPVIISSLKIEYGDKKFEMNSTAFIENYFVHNNSIEIKDKSKGEVIPKKDENGTYDPVFNSGENLKPELLKLYK